ncbi:Cytochrome P450 [Mycena sanguinolenta]|uniref:Cytochrome P450 n=1 Tax=Mycena sanguinolenta TaxID=230812 RepID=A0A8H6YUZ6_9AGAR|nr:Cytochrome P450 [Mycena sanguinolenta]
MITLLQLLWPFAATLLCYIIFHLSQILYRHFTYPLRFVRGPKSPSLLLGNFKQLGDDAYLTDKWQAQFGGTFRFHGLFSTNELHTTDIKAINHIVSKPDVYQKAPSMRASSELLVGRGILALENEDHRRHRRALNPAFGLPQIRVLTEIFVEKAVRLRDIWASQVALDENGAARIEVSSWLRRITLDVIGQAGFNYRFDALETDGKPNELNDAFTDLLSSPNARRYTAFRVAQGMAPILKLFPGPGQSLVRAAREKMFRIASEIVSKSKEDIKSSEAEKDLGGKRDLLSTLLKANLSASIPEAHRLNDAEVVSQIPTFFFAGHETTSLATSWALHALSAHPAAQSKLREELLTIPTDNPTMDELNSLPYLEAVVRGVRMAMQDDILPLAKPYIDKEGKSHDSLPIPKGQRFYIPILAINTDKEIWGEDAGKFKPERWEKVPESVSAIPGVYANLLTFFAGPHNCIGFRFSLVEIKAFLFTLIRAFEFEEAAKGGIGRVRVALFQKPAVLAEGPSSGLPLIVKLYTAQS